MGSKTSIPWTATPIRTGGGCSVQRCSVSSLKLASFGLAAGAGRSPDDHQVVTLSPTHWRGATDSPGLIAGGRMSVARANVVPTAEDIRSQSVHAASGGSSFHLVAYRGPD